MKPGRELDALVAEKVMGWVSVSKEHHWNYVRGYPAGWPDEYSGLPPDGYTGDDEFRRDYRKIHAYSSSIADAWLVVEKLKETKGRVSVDWFEDTIGYRWHVYVGEGDEQSVVGAETAPHAICLAALKAVGVEVK